MKSKTTVNLIILGLIAVSHIVYLFIPVGYAALFDRVCRPAIYATFVCALFFAAGRDERPIPKKYQAALIAAMGVILYFAVMLLAAYINGYAINGMVSSVRAFVNNLWVYGSFVVLSELLRFKMIRGAPANERAVTAVALTLVYTFVQLDGLRSAVNYGTEIGGFFFASVFPALALNSVLTYMALEGSFVSVLLLRGAYSLSPVLLPFLPNVTRPMWGAMSCAALFVTVVVYHFYMSDRSRVARHTAKRRSRYQKRSLSGIFITVVMIVFLAAFNMRVFPYFPVIVLTGSMEGAFDRGSVVFVEKAYPESVIVMVNEGDVIHFSRGRSEIIHRVIEFRYNAEGERVYITKGDANPSADPSPVEMGQVLGVCRAYIPYIGWPFIAINSIFNN